MSKLTVTTLKRVFIFEDTAGKEKIRLSDPNPKLTPEEVLDHYSAAYPSLSTALVLPGEQKGDIMEFEIKDNFGSKG